jgi:hypothetical protein
MTRIDTNQASAQSVRVTQIRTVRAQGESPLGPTVRDLLHRVGAALDAHRPLRVRVHGVVAADEECAISMPSKESDNARQGKRGPATRPREGATRRKGPSDRSRSTGASPRVGGDVLRLRYEGQLEGLAKAYPTCRALPEQDGMWLLATSSIIEGLEREATFIVAVPYRSSVLIRGWGFWAGGAQPWWIGPRHTNFGDGSICAFSPHDSVWSEGDDLVRLMDLYSVWAARHLHLEAFGRWPGKQYSFGVDTRMQAFYRQRECKDDELCGCGSETQRYAECCKPGDQQVDFIEAAGLFLQHVPGGFLSRKPPSAIITYIEGRSELPAIADIYA